MTAIVSLNDLQDATLDAVETISKSVFKALEQHAEAQQGVNYTLLCLSQYMSDRCKSAMLLVSYKQSWDAEIILRTVSETCGKTLFICYSEPSQRPVLAEEYWTDFEAINDVRTARKAQFAASMFARRGDVDNERIMSTLADPARFSLSSKLSKAQRAKIERKWSFSEIIEFLANRMGADDTAKDIRSLLHMYGMASHLAHADKSAMDLMIDRSIRSRNENNIVAAAQAARIMSDIVSYWYLTAIAVAHCHAVHILDEPEIISSTARARKLSGAFMDAFHDSQRDFYAGLVETPSDSR